MRTRCVATWNVPLCHYKYLRRPARVRARSVGPRDKYSCTSSNLVFAFMHKNRTLCSRGGTTAPLRTPAAHSRANDRDRARAQVFGFLRAHRTMASNGEPSAPVSGMGRWRPQPLVGAGFGWCCGVGGTSQQRRQPCGALRRRGPMQSSKWRWHRRCGRVGRTFHRTWRRVGEGAAGRCCHWATGGI